MLHAEGRWHSVDRAWDELVNDDTLFDSLAAITERAADDPALAAAAARPLAPVGAQEVWAAGVPSSRSRTARMEEPQTAGGGDFYDRVYAADRPELFLKATPHRVVGPGAALHLRRDSRWIVPEPELTLVITRSGRIVGYTIGNDLSCRDIEGENPLYLPQAKTFDRCAAAGPAVLVSREPPAPDTRIALVVRRGDAVATSDSTTVGAMKRSLAELVDYLFRENSHPHGVLLMTGTGLVPSDDFTLHEGDVVEITIDGIGTLINRMD